ncbi:acyl-CoA dehydratase activase [Candidatus Hydrogenedentota bacterium]
MFFAGVDIGSLSTDAVLMDDTGAVTAQAVMATGVRVAETANAALEDVCRQTEIGLSDLSAIVSTGYGRNRVEEKTKAITEITCHATGAHHLCPDTRLVIDVGGQDSKVIALDSTGRVENFAMNDKCAAGTGRFLEVMARILEVDLDDFGPLALESRKTLPISNVCTVFAESEVISLLSMGEDPRDIAAGLCKSVAERVRTLASRVELKGPVTMTGGVAKNIGVVKALETALKLDIRVPEEPQTVGALGAALHAMNHGGAVSENR